MRARIATLALVATAATAFALVTCSDGGPISADGGDEYGIWHPPDGGSDGSEGGADAGVDGCGVTSDWAGFRRLSEFSPCLPADVLVDNDAGYNMAWTDCGDAGILGCKELASPYPPGAAYATHDDGGSARGLALILDVDGTTRQLDIFDLATLTRRAEWRITVDQADAFLGLTNTQDMTTDFLGWRSSGFVAATAPVQTLAASNPMTLQSYPAAPNQVINWVVSEQVMAFQSLASPYAICTVDAGTCVPMNIASIAPAVPYLTFAWHEVAFAVAQHGTTGWAQEYVIHADGSIALLRSNAGAHVWGMTTDGTTLVWEETYGSTNFLAPQTTTEVWKAPFTTDKSTLDTTATKVTTLPTAGIGGSNLAELDFFNGLYATHLKPPADAIYVVDVATGQVQAVPKGPPGLLAGVSGLPYVDKNELWQVTIGQQSSYHLVRIPFSQAWK